MEDYRISSSDVDKQLVEPLTSRELEVLKLFAAGFSNKEVAEHLTLALSTVKWYARQIFSKLAVNNRTEAVEHARELGIIESAPRLSNLPKPTTPFIGRLEELRAIKRLILDPHNRLITLIGLGGIGKTRLAIQCAEELLAGGKNYFRDGVYFVPLEAVYETGAIVSAVAATLGFQFYEGRANAREQVINYLRDKRLLLVLDNFEHLINESSAKLIIEMQNNAPGLNLLITSRERLNQPGEQVYTVRGMPIPDVEDPEWVGDVTSRGSTYSSVALFLQAARRAQADFNPDVDEMNSIVEICRFVDGMPLGIELAAAWIPVLKPTAFLQEMRQNMDIFETDMRALPNRQRSLRAVFDTSWKLLTVDEQRAVIRLSVFRGGFSRQSAVEVSDVSIKALLGLVNKSWIQSIPGDRYNFHPVVYFYARKSAGDEFDPLKQRHAEYYCSFLSDIRGALYNQQQKEQLIELEAEIINLQDAWKTAIEWQRFDLIDQVVDGYCTFFDLRSDFDEGAHACAIVINAIDQANSSDKFQRDESIPGLCLMLKLLTWQAHFTRDYQKQADLINRAQVLLNDPEFPEEACKSTYARLLCVHGQHIAWEDRVRSAEYFEGSMELASKLGERYIQALAMASLGWNAWVTGDAERGEKHLRGSLDISREIGNQRGIAYCLNMLAILARDIGRLEKAETLQREGLALLEGIGASFQIAQQEYVYASTIAFQGDFDRAFQIVDRCERRFVELGYRGPFLAKPYTIKGFILLDLGRYDEAQENTYRGLKIARQYNNQQDIGIALGVLGSIFHVRAEYESALECLADSYERLKAIKHFRRGGIPVANLINVNRRVGNLNRALEYLKIGLNILHKSKKVLFAGYILYPAAHCLIEIGANQLAIMLITKAQQYPNLVNSRWVADVYGEQTREFMASLNDKTIREAEVKVEELDIWDIFSLVLENLA